MDARLDELYAQLPTINCTGACWGSCGPIDMTHRERQRIREHGVKIPHYTVTELAIVALSNEGAMCPALVNRRCSVYLARPLICRLYGITEAMKCPHGCVPSPRYLNDGETHDLFTEVMLIGGHELVGGMSEAEFRAHAATQRRTFRPTVRMRAFEQRGQR